MEEVPNDVLTEYRDIFRLVDVDHSGTIDRTEHVKILLSTRK